jgi:hypothetical protein
MMPQMMPAAMNHVKRYDSYAPPMPYSLGLSLVPSALPVAAVVPYPTPTAASATPMQASPAYASYAMSGYGAMQQPSRPYGYYANQSYAAPASLGRYSTAYSSAVPTATVTATYGATYATPAVYGTTPAAQARSPVAAPMVDRYTSPSYLS